MVDILNLKRARKQKARAEKEKKAAQNRLDYGLSKVERASLAKTKDRLDTSLDGKQLGRASIKLDDKG